MVGTKNALMLLVATIAMSQGAPAQESKPAEKPAEAPAAPPKEESSVTDHTIRIGGQAIPYKATAATILIKNDKDEPTALVYYTAYTRTEAKDMSQRPVSFLSQRRAGLIVRLIAHRLDGAAARDDHQCRCDAAGSLQTDGQPGLPARQIRSGVY